MVGNKGSSIKRHDHGAIVGYLFTLPSFVGFCIFVLIPLVWAAIMSFQDYNVFTGASTFTGLKNYLDLFKDTRTLTILGNTIWYCIFCTFFNTSIGLILAVIVNNKLAKSASVFFRSIYFFPSLISLTFVAVIWCIFFQTDSGVINYYLNFVGVNSVPWLSDSNLSKISVLIIDIWKNSGMSMLLILSGLQTIDGSLMEAASIDGANEFKKFFRITLPLLTPTLFFVLIMHLTGSLRIFESAFVLTNGGPGDSSRSLVMLITEKAFTSFNYGQANALSMLLMLLIAVITAVQFMTSRWWVNYD